MLCWYPLTSWNLHQSWETNFSIPLLSKSYSNFIQIIPPFINHLSFFCCWSSVSSGITCTFTHLVSSSLWQFLSLLLLLVTLTDLRNTLTGEAFCRMSLHCGFSDVVLTIRLGWWVTGKRTTDAGTPLVTCPHRWRWPSSCGQGGVRRFPHCHTTIFLLPTFSYLRGRSRGGERRD